MALFAVTIYTLYDISTEKAYIEAAGRQTVYRLDVADGRGMIYDCNMEPLVNQTRQNIAAVAPNIESIAYLNRELTKDDPGRFSAQLESGKPFTIEVPEDFQAATGIHLFQVPKRYASDQIAEHIIGYLNSQGEGAAGIELAMDDFLNRKGSGIEIYYQIDALGRVIAGDETKIVDGMADAKSGVVLSLDGRIQRAAEQAAEKLGGGAIVVTEMENCELRALVSTPGYSPDNLGAYTLSEDAPLINRAFSAFSPGSVFKIVTAAQQIEEGNEGHEYECNGTISVNGRDFGCVGKKAHGKIKLEDAFAKSCNCYFIDSALKIGGQPLLTMAYNLGLGAQTEFGRGLFSDSGNLPEAKSLLSERAMANFAIGQGEVELTTLQAAVMINCIASGGVYSQPKLIAGTVDDDMEYTAIKSQVIDQKIRVMEPGTAKKLMKYMQTTINSGTGAAAKPSAAVAGGKTGTAQTGAFEGDIELNHYWFTGYISDDSGPRYAISIVRESVGSDNGATGTAFKEIADYISDNVF